MKKLRHSARAASLQVVGGLTLAFAIGIVANAYADEGGYFCGYGDCWFQYSGANCSTSYTNLGGGMCEITINGDCDYDMGCSGDEFTWHELSVGSSWRVGPPIEVD